jgi:alkanesulfonate monooxygenase SsuD/methylene tetrahydromethanopterin reductase-like flavin-dependent oxidoreductase (luciferase family)
MHIGLMMECDFREGGTQREAFDEAFATAEAAEALGFDGIWLAERHFAALGTPGASGRGSRHAGSPEPRPPRPRDWSEQFPPIL